jgi:nucleoside-diphosphate-sugar epimerase
VGSAGFIGGRIFDALRRDADPVEIVTVDIAAHPGSGNHHRCDVASDAFVSGALADLRFDTILNLAAEHRDDVRPVSRYFEVNVIGAEKVCELARRTGASRIVFTSSVAVYGFAPPGTGEDGELRPFNEYGRTKALAEDVYRDWQAEAPKTRSLAIIRPTVVFGPGNRGNVHLLIRQIARGPFVMIGSGANMKSMAFVDNVAAFLIHCLGFGPGVHLHNYVDGPDLSTTELVETVRTLLGRPAKGYARVPAGLGRTLGRAGDLAAKALGRPVPISSIRVEKFLATTRFSSSAATTGFRPGVDLPTGLRLTLEAEAPETGARLPAGAFPLHGDRPALE